MNTANDLVEEGLVYFERSGDEGDKEYVRAIRAHIAHLTTPPKVAVSDEDFARDVAEYLQFNGWATGGDLEEDFLPDVRRAIAYARDCSS